jgi:hypothetical protein
MLLPVDSGAFLHLPTPAIATANRIFAFDGRL